MVPSGLRRVAAWGDAYMEKYAGPIVGVAVVALIGLGLYTMQLQTDLGKAKSAAAASAQQAATLQKQATDAATKAGTSANELHNCQLELKTAQDQLAAAPKPRGKR
jgi:hypothetical protein